MPEMYKSALSSFVVVYFFTVKNNTDALTSEHRGS